MRLTKSVLLSLSFLSVFIVLARPTGAGIFNPETFSLSNGMQVVVIPNDRAPAITHMVWYKVGAADEPRGKSGIAHYLEHLMFKGTKSQPAGAFSRLIKKVGGRENAFTSQDYTAYFQTVAKTHLGRMMALEADRMENLQIRDEDFLAELDVVLEERRTRTESTPRGRLSEMVQAASYMAYPYRVPTIGWEHEIRALKRQDVFDFYRTWYAPNNAILVVAGDTSVEEVKRLAEATYGKIKARPVPDRIALRGQEPPHVADRTVTMKSERVRQPSWSRRWLAPSRGWGESELVEPLEIFASIFGGSATSRLHQRLVLEEKLAVSVGAFYGGEGIGPSSFGLYASPRPDVSIEKLEGAVMVELDRMLEEGVTEEELSAVKTRMRRAAIFARDDSLAPARVFGAALVSGGTIADVEEWPERMAAVTREAVVEAARKTLRGKASTTSLLLPKNSGSEG